MSSDRLDLFPARPVIGVASPGPLQPRLNPYQASLMRRIDRYIWIIQMCNGRLGQVFGFLANPLKKHYIKKLRDENDLHPQEFEGLAKRTQIIVKALLAEKKPEELLDHYLCRRAAEYSNEAPRLRVARIKDPVVRELLKKQNQQRPVREPVGNRPRIISSSPSVQIAAQSPRTIHMAVVLKIRRVLSEEFTSASENAKIPVYLAKILQGSKETPLLGFVNTFRIIFNYIAKHNNMERIFDLDEFAKGNEEIINKKFLPLLWEAMFGKNREKIERAQALYTTTIQQLRNPAPSKVHAIAHRARKEEEKGPTQ